MICISFIEMTRKRKAVSYRIDEEIITAIKKAAKNQGISDNRWLENFLFDSLQTMGLIDKELEKLGENRGGDRKSAKLKSQLGKDSDQ